MRRVFAACVLCLMAAAAFAQAPQIVLEKPFRPANPVVVGQGGSFTANGYGFNSFFGNPASLTGKGSFTLLSVNPWIYSTGEMMQFVTDMASMSGSSRAADTITLNLPDGWETLIPAEYEGTPAQFQADLEQAFNEFADAAGITDITEVNIPESWMEIDPTTILESSDYSELAPYLTDFIDANPEIGNAIQDAFLSEVLPEGFPKSPKLRAGVAAGAGLIVGGFGLGIAGILDATVGGSSLLSAKGAATFTVGFMGGFAHEFKLSDRMGISVGGLLRPMFRVNAPVSVNTVLNAFSPGSGGFDVDSLLNSLTARYGTGIGIDVGAILRMGPFNVGMSVTDLFGTTFNYRQAGLVELIDELTDGDDPTLPEGTRDETKRYVVPMDLRLGASFHPNLRALSFLIDPTVHLEIGNFIPVARARKLAKDAGEDVPPLRLAEIAAFGAEVRVLRIAAVRLGYYQGAISAGLGLHLLFLDANVAAYLGPKGDQTVQGATGWADLGDVGFTAELAIRF